MKVVETQRGSVVEIITRQPCSFDGSLQKSAKVTGDKRQSRHDDSAFKLIYHNMVIYIE